MEPMSRATIEEYIRTAFLATPVTEEEGVRTVLRALSHSIHEDQTTDVISILLSDALRQYMVLFLSSKEIGDRLVQSVLLRFPLTLQEFCSSMTCDLLSYLGHTLPFVYPFDRDIILEISQRLSLIHKARRLLLFLNSFSEAVQPPVVDSEDTAFLKAGQSQRARKAAKKTPKVDINITQATEELEAFNLDVPEDIVEAKMCSKYILDNLYNVTKFYLSLVGQNVVFDAVLTQILAVAEPEPSPATTFVESSPEHVEKEVAPPGASAYPHVQPMKAALYFDSVEGFGEWRILVSTRADRDLREARRKDSHFFKIVVKKIKELSRGHFSDDNQKRLNGSNSGIPIFEAKMTRDSRLVYQVDCVPEYDTDNTERQVIKIFGIYTHAQLDKRLWDSISAQLCRKGKEYRDRCVWRNKPVNTGDNVFTPASFPALEATLEVDTSRVPSLPDDTLEEVHSLLVLEKFVVFSQVLLNSIIADIDVAHVFDVSPQEMSIVQHPYSCYVLGRSGTGKTTTMLFKMLGIERAYLLRKETMSKPRQIFVTQSRVLAGKVDEYFQKLLESLNASDKSREELVQLAAKRRVDNESGGLVDLDDDDNWRSDLPAKFSKLRDEHFPLFLTFDKLASMLEADAADYGGMVKSEITNNTLHDVKKGSTIIDYNKFRTSYWPHFPQALRKGLDPALVFSELMGVIQGSEESLQFEARHVEKAAYKGLSHRAQYMFANRRETIYSIFQTYLKQKRLGNEYDAADRTHRILKTIEENGIPGKRIDYLYADEAQDNLLIDSYLLRLLVHNPDGLFFAGDTAQTISLGSSFRFNDLKAFLFRLEERQRAKSSKLAPQEPPKTFQLSVNYRSHDGIVRCAHSVIELITEFWPYAIDSLTREQGVVDGPKPVFFSGWDSETVRYEQFLFGETGNTIEFGAQQCILVRDEDARTELRKQVGEIGLIMTLYESKGLEFDDVLLYKFFEHSSVEQSQWRLVFNLLDSEASAAPKFDEVRHAALCTELKFLYVAITRARKNLWIVDCSEKCEPMRIFWTAKDQVQNCTPGTDVPRLAKSSSPEEWFTTGRALFNNKRYLQAMHCFERAGKPREAEIAHTYHMREQARGLPTHGSKHAVADRQKAFEAAAEAFLRCADSAVNQKTKRVYLRTAGDCFMEAGDDFIGKAAEVYAKAGEYTLSAKLYRKCGKFDQAVGVVTKYRDEVESSVVDDVIGVAKLYYHQADELKKASALFESVDDHLEYLEDFGLDTSKAAVLESIGRHSDAAEVHLSEGRTLEAIRLFLRDKSNEQSTRQAHAAILEGLWKHISFAIKPKSIGSEGKALLALAAREKATGLLDKKTADIFTMFEAINSSDKATLRALGRTFATYDRPAALLCLENAAVPDENWLSGTLTEASSFLADFDQYCELMATLSVVKEPCTNADVRKLFGIVALPSGDFLLPKESSLHDQLLQRKRPIISHSEAGVTVSRWELDNEIVACAQERLVARIIALHSFSRNAKVVAPCLHYVYNGSCFRPNCPRQHAAAAKLTKDWLHAETRLHFQQISILRFLRKFCRNPREVHSQIGFWVQRVYELFFPLSHYFGGATAIDIALVPDSKRGLGCLMVCTQDLLSQKHPLDNRTLTTVYQSAKIFMLLKQDKDQAWRELAGSLRLMQFTHAPVYRHAGTIPGSWSLVHDVVYSMVKVYEAPLHGIPFLSHILERSFSLDIFALCDLVDYLCAATLLARHSFSVHGITLPRSFFIFAFRVPPGPRPPNFEIDGLLNRLITSTLELIGKFLRSGENELEQFLCEGSGVGKRHFFRNIVISRLCRSVCLLGYNVNNEPLRMKILQGLAPLRQVTPIPAVYREYALARNWSGIFRAVLNSTTGSTFDELIEFLYESKGNRPPTNVRRIIVKDFGDAVRTLEKSHLAAGSTLSINAPAFVPVRKTEAKEDAKPDAMEDGEDEDQQHEDLEIDTADIVNKATSMEMATPVPITGASVQLTPQQIHAGEVFRDAYRACLRRRRRLQVQRPRHIDVYRDEFYAACVRQVEANDTEWPRSSFYRKLFLGPVPSLLAAVKVSDAWAQEAKRKNKERFKKAQHTELEEVQKRLTEQKKQLDRIKRFTKALEPTAEIHKKRDIHALKRLVIDVQAFYGELPGSVQSEAANELMLAYRGIVEDKKVVQPAPKPALVVDDDEDI